MRAGEIVGLAEPSGSGKSTLCDLLLGLRQPVAGQVLWRGQDIAGAGRLRRTVQRSVQKLFQDPGAAFPPHRRLRGVFGDLAAVTEAPLDRLPLLLDRLGVRADVLGLAVLLVSHDDALLAAMASRTVRLSPPG